MADQSFWLKGLSRETNGGHIRVTSDGGSRRGPSSPAGHSEELGLSGTSGWVLLREPGGPAHLLEEAEGQGSDAAKDTNTIVFALVA